VRVEALGGTSLLVQAGGVRLLTDPLPEKVEPLPDYLVVSHGHGDHVRGLRLYPVVPRVGNRVIASRPRDIAVSAWREVRLGGLRLVAVPTPGHPHVLQRLPGYDLLLSLCAPGSGVRRCGESLGYVFGEGEEVVWWTGDMCWDPGFVDGVLRRYRPGAVYVHVQRHDLGWLNLLVPEWRLSGLVRRVDVVPLWHSG